MCDYLGHPHSEVVKFTLKYFSNENSVKCIGYRFVKEIHIFSQISNGNGEYPVTTITTGNVLQAQDPEKLIMQYQILSSQ